MIYRDFGEFMNNKNVCLMLISIFAVACSKKDLNRNVQPIEPVNTPKQTSISDFQGKSNEEILKIKYDKIVLKCQFWSQYTEKLDLALSPNDSFEVDFLNDLTLSKSLMSLKGSANGKTTILDFKLTDYEIRESLRHKGLNGKIYVLQFSPMLNLEYNFQSTSFKSENGGITSGPVKGYNRGSRILEGDHNYSTESLQIADEPRRYIDHLDCTLDSIIKEKYKDQFKVIETN